MSACVDRFCVPSEALVTPKPYRLIRNECYSQKAVEQEHWDAPVLI